MHLVGFIIRIYHDARSSECQIRQYLVSNTSHTLPDLNFVREIPTDKQQRHTMDHKRVYPITSN